MIRSLRNWLRSHRRYGQLRATMRTGFVRTAKWRFRERLILRSGSFPTRPVGDRSASCEVRIMTWRGDWRLALWAAKSFYHFARVEWPITFHDGGGLDRRITRELVCHFPNARVIGWDEATRMVEPELLEAGFSNVARARRANVMVRKLVDFAFLAAAPNMMCMDSDVLIVGRPDELIRLGEGRPDTLWFNRDSHDMYSITREQAAAWFGLELPGKVNAGLSLIPVRSIDMEFLDRAFAPDRIPVDKDVFPEQTVCALLSAQIGGPAFLPPAYSVATGTPPLDVRALGLVSRHYVGPVRYLMYEEGMPFLIRNTTLLIST